MQFDGHAKTLDGNWRFPPAAVRLPHRGEYKNLPSAPSLRPFLLRAANGLIQFPKTLLARLFP